MRTAVAYKASDKDWFFGTNTSTTNSYVTVNSTMTWETMEACMWCGKEFRHSQLDEHEDGCGA